MKKLSIIFWVLTSFIIGGFFYFNYLISIPGPFSENKLVVVPKGASVVRTAYVLKSESIIDNPIIFRILAKIKAQDTKLHAGEFEFPAGASVAKVLEIIVSGKTYQRQLTIAEGLTVKQIFEKINEIEVLTGEISLKVKDGELLPDTYNYSKNDSKDSLVLRMRESMTKAIDELWETRQDGLPIKNKEQAIILASIIERETGIDGERGKVSSVFVNRLRKGMRLQTDPTVIYAMSNGYGEINRKLYTNDLKIDSPYNTYKNYGLPIGAISNPGIESIMAALNPEDTDYLYFVANGTGGHSFSKTLREHNNRVIEWKRFKKSQK